MILIIVSTSKIKFNFINFQKGQICKHQNVLKKNLKTAEE